jgi:hypothetical protein
MASVIDRARAMFMGVHGPGHGPVYGLARV